MLTHYDRKGADACKQYFSKQERAEGVEAHPVRFMGKLAEKMGLLAEYSRDTFNRLVEGKAPDGKLTPRRGGVIGTEWVFNSPKSASLAAEFAPDGSKIVQAFRDAVKEAVETVAEVNAHVRTHPDGSLKTVNMPSGTILGSGFLHLTARAAKESGLPMPHMHEHVLIHNVTTNPLNGQRLALKATQIHRNAARMEKVFLDGYRARIEALGYRTVSKGKGFELADIPASTLRKFSERRVSIERFYEQFDKVTPGIRRVAALKTRQPKAEVIDLDALRSKWACRLTQHERGVFDSLRARPKVNRPLKRRKAFVAKLVHMTHHPEKGRDHGLDRE